MKHDIRIHPSIKTELGERANKLPRVKIRNRLGITVKVLKKYKGSEILKANGEDFKTMDGMKIKPNKRYSVAVPRLVDHYTNILKAYRLDGMVGVEFYEDRIHKLMRRRYTWYKLGSPFRWIAKLIVTIKNSLSKKKPEMVRTSPAVSK